MNQRYASRGFAFVKLDYATKLDPETRTIDVTFLVERGPEARFGRITVSGNVSTRDKIVRRELTFSEGDIFNSEALRRSRQKVTNLGFFETVDLVPRPRGDNVIDIDIEVKEKLTGAITFGVGYSSEDKLTGQLRISENNLFGRGHSLALTFEKSPVRANYSLSFTEPSLFDTPWSAGFSIYNTEREYDEYDRKSIGGSLTFGRSLGEYLRSYVRLKHETVTVGNIDARRRHLPASAQEGTATTNSVRLSFVRDTRDNYMNPTRGNRTSLAGEYAGGILGGDNYFTKFEVEHSFYTPLFLGPRGDDPRRIRQHQRLRRSPAARSTRSSTSAASSRCAASRIASVGPKDINGDPTGGTQQLYFNTEIIVPVAPAQGFNLVVFYDTGNAWDVRGPSLDDLRQSAGVGIRWMSPMGPFRLEWGYVLDPQPGEPTVRLGLHDRQLLLVVTAAEKGPSAALPSSRLPAACTQPASVAGSSSALHLDPSEHPLRSIRSVDRVAVHPYCHYGTAAMQKHVLGGGVARRGGLRRRNEVSTMEVRSVRTPQPARRQIVSIFPIFRVRVIITD